MDAAEGTTVALGLKIGVPGPHGNQLSIIRSNKGRRRHSQKTPRDTDVRGSIRGPVVATLGGGGRMRNERSFHCHRSRTLGREHPLFLFHF